MLNWIQVEHRIISNAIHAAVVLSLLLVASCFLPGCQSGDAEQSPPVADTPEARPVAVDRQGVDSQGVDSQGVNGQGVNGQGVASMAVAPRETWDAIYMGGAKVGHTQTQFEPIQEAGQMLVRIKSVSEMTMKRFGQTIEQKITVTSIEHPDGRLVRFSSSMGAPPDETVTKGHYENRKLRLTTTTTGKSMETALAWDPTWRGFFGPEQALEGKPLKPGQKRTIRTLMPVFNMIGEIEFTAIGYESTKLLNDERTLLRIESRTRMGGISVDSILWTDARGETIKTSIPSLNNQETFRTTREIALQSSGEPTFDLGDASVVKVERPLARPHLCENIVYRATISDGDPVKAFPACATQSVKRLDAHTAEITVQAIRPETAVERALGAGTPPVKGDIEPNNLIQSDDPNVVAIANSVAKDETNAWFIAQALEKRIQDLVQVTEFSRAIASAAEVARTKQGDCTEHAMLLAATCRSRQIPARVAIGLVYYGQAGGFAYHMWTEVWINRHWIPLDATLGQGGIGAAHLKVADSNLADGSGYTAILPVFEVMGRLKLEIVAVDGKPSSPK